MARVFEAGLDGVTIESEGSKLLGGFYRAAGFGRRPTAILLHGLPGVEKNFDVAYELRDLGWNCMYFHYRGSWGSEGNFSLDGRPEDLRAATAWIIQQACVDAERLVLVGHSAGGYLALTETAADGRYKAVVALCPLISPARRVLTISGGVATLPLQAATGEELIEKADQARYRAKALGRNRIVGA